MFHSTLRSVLRWFSRGGTLPVRSYKLSVQEEEKDVRMIWVFESFVASVALSLITPYRRTVLSVRQKKL
jgi:hypothetical protein